MIVLCDAAVAQSAVAARQPGDGAFDHGSVLAVFGQPVGVTGGPACGALSRVVCTHLELFAFATAGASGPQRAARAGRTEGRNTGMADWSGQPIGAGDGAVVVIDDEIIDGEPTRDRPGHWCGFDPVGMPVLDQFGTEFPCPIGRIGQYVTGSSSPPSSASPTAASWLSAPTTVVNAQSVMIPVSGSTARCALNPS